MSVRYIDVFHYEQLISEWCISLRASLTQRYFEFCFDVCSFIFLSNIKSMIKEYIKKKWEWVDKNPRLASWLGWLKGLITGLLIYYFIDNYL